MEARELFESQLEVIERIIRSISRRHALSRDDEEEFGSTVRMRLMEDDYAIIAKFRGHSAFLTYLTVVITNLFRDFRNARWGRWRASALARRMGPAGVRLERHLYRDRYPLDEAIEAVRSAMAADAPSPGELRRMASRLEPRALPRHVSDARLARMPANDRADVAVLAAESLAEQALISTAIDDVLSALEPEDQVICRMKFWDDFSIADVARTLHLPQKPLYRRLEKLQHTIREALELRGVDRERASSLLRAAQLD